MSDAPTVTPKQQRFLAVLSTLLLLTAGAFILSGQFYSQNPNHLNSARLTSSENLKAEPGRNTNHPALTPADPKTKARIDEAYGKLPMQFEKNAGQISNDVRFFARGAGYNLFLTPAEAVLSLKDVESKNQKERLNDESILKHPEVASLKNESVIRMELVGGRTTAEIAGVDELPGKSNYLIGKDSRKWRTDVSTFKRVKYRNVYPGIDLVYYGNQRQLEYDFVVSAHSDPKAIRLRFSGLLALKTDSDGTLVLTTSSGEEIHQAKPVIYQETGVQRTPVEGSYVLRGQEVSFEVGDYDASRTLVIDPTLVYSTFLGGSDYDSANDIQVDSSGAAYVCGYTQSANFPTFNPRQPLPGDDSDAFITKLNASGTALVYSTYLGGADYDFASGIALDATGNVYVTGQTISNDFPLVNPKQGSRSGISDAFITKLNPAGNAFVYSTYLGGNGAERGNSIVVDSSNNAFITGFTSSTNFPTQTPRQGSSGGGAFDAFLTKLSVNGSTLVYSTYHGGSGSEVGTKVALDSSGNAYVGGYTSSTDFPTASPRQGSNGGGQDGFVSKFSATGTTLLNSSYLGGSGDDSVSGIAVLSAGTAFVTGQTTSTNFPTQNPSQANYGGNVDAFVSKINTAGTFDYSTYLGGTNQDSGYAIAIDTSGNAYVVGDTTSGDFPKVNALRSMLAVDGEFDGFVTKLNVSGSVVFSTFLGGTDEDFVTAVAKSGSAIFIIGETRSSDFPITAGAFQQTKAANAEGFIAKIDETTNPVFFAIRGHLSWGPDPTSSNANGPAAGVPVQLSGSQSKTVITNSEGNYIFQLLPTGGNYSVTPDASFATTPSVRNFNALAANVPNADFVSNKVVEISGRVTNVNGRGLGGVTVAAFDPDAAQFPSISTDSNGHYSLFVPAGGNYTVKPNNSPTVTAWLPADSITHPNLTQDINNDDFIARFPAFNVSGKVRNASGTVIYPGVTLRLNGPSTTDFTTASDGLYTVVGLNSLGDYTFTPQPFTSGGITYNLSPASVSFMSMTTCDLNGSRPPGVFCSGFDYLGMDFVATPAPVEVTIQTNPAGRTVSIDGGAPVANPTPLQWVPGSQHTIATTSPQAGTAGTQYVFSNWSDGGAISHTVTTPTTSTTYTANFTTQFHLTMNAGSGGTVLPASGFFNSGQSVQITATPNSGFGFSGWTGTGTGSFTGPTNPVNITMNAPITQAAAFTQNPVTVTIQTNPAGRTVSIDGGAPLANPTPLQWTPGSQHTIATASPQAGTAGTQYVFSNWSDGGAISHTVTAPATATNYTASFATQFQLTMSAGSGGTVLPASGFFNSGQSVQITATPNSGFGFSGWTGTGTGSFTGPTNPVNITMNAPITQTAAFTQNPVAVTIQTNPAGRTVSIDGGAPVANPTPLQWIPGSQHTIATTAIQAGAAGTQYAFGNWSDGGAISHTITIPSTATTYTANFITQFQLTMSAGSGGTVLPGSGFINSGQVVQITATPNSGFSFSGWTGNGTGSFTGSTNPVNITMNAPITQTASFVVANSVQFSSANVSANEGAKKIEVTVTRGSGAGAASIDYATSDTAGANNCNVINGAASSRCDYLTTLGTLQFAVGETSKVISILLIDDVFVEGNETFTITLSNPVGATLGTASSATLTIIDNDVSPGAGNPIDGPSFFVRQHYLDFLNREPDDSGLAFWTSEITGCGSNVQCVEIKRINVSAAFFLSIEFQETGYLVYRFYKSGFGNLSGTPVPVRFLDFLKDTQQIGKGVSVGAQGWEALLEANKQAYALGFVQRADFLTAFPNSMTADQFVSKLNTNAANALSPAEQANLVTLLGATPSDLTKRSQVLRMVAEDVDLKNAEFNKAFVLMQYFGYMRRSPNDAPDTNFDGFNFWLTKLDTFNGNFINAEMVKAFITSIEYRNRFAP